LIGRKEGKEGRKKKKPWCNLNGTEEAIGNQQLVKEEKTTVHLK
jgi:hypothetical protein